MVMPVPASVEALTYQKVIDYLKNSTLFKNSLRTYPDQPKLDVLYGSALIEIEVLPWDVHPWDETDLATVRATSCVTVGSSINAELMHYLLDENRRMRFGAFSLDDAGQILFSESILGGDNMDLMELQACILSVVTIADTYDDMIARRFGGQRASDGPEGAVFDYRGASPRGNREPQS